MSFPKKNLLKCIFLFNKENCAVCVDNDPLPVAGLFPFSLPLSVATFPRYNPLMARCSQSPSLCMPHGHQLCSGPSLVLGPPQGRHPRCKGCGKGFLGKSRVNDGFVSPFSHANSKRVFLPASPRLALMYFRDNFSILQTPH